MKGKFMFTGLVVAGAFVATVGTANAQDGGSSQTPKDSVIVVDSCDVTMVYGDSVITGKIVTKDSSMTLTMERELELDSIRVGNDSTVARLDSLSTMPRFEEDSLRIESE